MIGPVFQIRQRVECIGTKGTPGRDWDAYCAAWGIARPARGSIYTIRDARLSLKGPVRQHVRLVEIINPVIKFKDAPDQEQWFWAEGFRAIIEQSTDTGMAMLRRLQNPQHQRIPEDA